MGRPASPPLGPELQSEALGFCVHAFPGVYLKSRVTLPDGNAPSGILIAMNPPRALIGPRHFRRALGLAKDIHYV